jgi:choline dehydrogenase-like flavoprotein
VEVEANEPVKAAREVRIKTPNGNEHRAEATHYVLACGAIQNARLLLASNRQAPNGLGNDHDLVGRYFMEHIEMPGAQLALTERQPIKLYVGGGPGRPPSGELSLTENVQRERNLLNGTASLQPDVFEDLKGTFQRLPPEVVKQFWNRSDEPDGKGGEGEAEGEEGPSRPSPSKLTAFKLFTRQEQAPNPHSRVTLTDETDAIGMPRVALDWQLTELDKRSIRGFYEALGREMGRSGLGRVQILDWLLEGDDSSWPDFVSGGWHHMGTARMSDDPSQGVVDPNGKVHRLSNLYVAGSAVYPTAGSANPTLTLIALTLRLSDHLKTKIG